MPLIPVEQTLDYLQGLLENRRNTLCFNEVFDMLHQGRGSHSDEFARDLQEIETHMQNLAAMRKLVGQGCPE